VAAPLTVGAYRSGRDPALEAIASYVPRPSLGERLKPLLVARDSVAVGAALAGWRADPVNAWEDPAEWLAGLSGELRYEGKADAAELADRLRTRLAEWVMPR
jgi:hypothetical protein